MRIQQEIIQKSHQGQVGVLLTLLTCDRRTAEETQKEKLQIYQDELEMPYTKKMQTKMIKDKEFLLILADVRVDVW